jgi:hypothetical protein
LMDSRFEAWQVAAKLNEQVAAVEDCMEQLAATPRALWVPGAEDWLEEARVEVSQMLRRLDGLSMRLALERSGVWLEG